MPNNYLQYKLFLISRSYRDEISLEGNSILENSVDISLVAVDSIPYFCVSTSENNVSALMSAIQAHGIDIEFVNKTHPETNFDGLPGVPIVINAEMASAIDLVAHVLPAGLILSNIKDANTVNPNAIFASARQIKSHDINTMLDVLTRILVKNTARIISKINQKSDIKAELSISKGFVNTQALLKNIASSEVQMTLLELTQLFPWLKNANHLNGDLSLISPTATKLATSSYTQHATTLSSAPPAATKTETQNDAILNANIFLARVARLDDYTNNSLSELNHRSLQSLRVWM